MKGTVAGAVALVLVSASAIGSPYKCVDEDGTVIYSDRRAGECTYADGRPLAPAPVSRAQAIAPASAPRNPACRPAAQVERDIKAWLAEVAPGQYTGGRVVLERNMQDYRALCALDLVDDDAAILQRLLDVSYPNFTGIRVVFERERADRDAMR